MVLLVFVLFVRKHRKKADVVKSAWLIVDVFCRCFSVFSNSDALMTMFVCDADPWKSAEDQASSGGWAAGSDRPAEGRRPTERGRDHAEEGTRWRTVSCCDNLCELNLLEFDSAHIYVLIILAVTQLWSVVWKLHVVKEIVKCKTNI